MLQEERPFVPLPSLFNVLIFFIPFPIISGLEYHLPERSLLCLAGLGAGHLGSTHRYHEGALSLDLSTPGPLC